MINFTDDAKTTRANLLDAVTGGTNPATAGSVSTYLATGPGGGSLSHDALIALGFKYICYNRPFGNVTTPGTNGYVGGTIPFDYPDTSSRGLGAAIDPLSQTQNETIFGGTSYTAQLVSAHNTAGRKGSLYGGYLYYGLAPANSAVTNADLDNYGDVATAMGCSPIHDAESIIAYANYAPPTLMGTNVLGWWEADRQAYTSTGTTSNSATANNDPVYHWDSLYGSASWVRQSADANRPFIKTSAVNGYPSLLFDGTNDRMTLASPLSPGAAFTICMVVKPTALDEILVSAAAAITNRQIRFNETAAGRISFYDGTNLTQSANSSVTAGTWAIVRFRHTGTVCKMYVNGTETSYAVAAANESNMIISMLGAFGNGGASNFFSGELAALAIMDANCTDNQVQLMEAYWAAKYAITVSGTPTLPHKGYVDRLFSVYGVSPLREAWGYRNISTLTGWNTHGGGVLGFAADYATAIAAPTSFYTPASINGRAMIMVPNNGPSVATRTASILSALYAGVDAVFDSDGFSSAQLNALNTTYLSLISGIGSTGARGRALHRRRFIPFIRN